MSTNSDYTFVVIGGGIAGVTCAETLAILNDSHQILLITKSEIVKTVSSAINIGQTITELSVSEVSVEKIQNKYENLTIVTGLVNKLNYAEKTIETENGLKFTFVKLCICTGGKARLIDESNPFVIGIRDTESVAEFEKRIASARRIMIVGNGGIASEIVHEVEGVDKIWVIKDGHISKTFIDAGAGEFFRERLQKDGHPETVIRRLAYTASGYTGAHPVSDVAAAESQVRNPALGPDWHKNFSLRGTAKTRGDIILEYASDVGEITAGDGEWPVLVTLSNGKRHGVDFIVSATGVSPNSETFARGNDDLATAEDGGIVVDWKMETSLGDVFAAGDVASAGWTWAPHWLQMRLWTQAMQMGTYAAKSMVASLNDEPLLQDFCFEMFSHVTRLFGFKVVLLGLFNGQKLEDGHELMLRITKGREYIKLVLKNGRLQGALLIGDTDLEEMCENLILNQLDLTPYGEDILNPNIDIDDYFD